MATDTDTNTRPSPAILAGAAVGGALLALVVITWALRARSKRRMKGRDEVRA